MSVRIIADIAAVLPYADLALASLLLDVEPLVDFLGDLLILTGARGSEAALDEASIDRLIPVFLSLAGEEDHLKDALPVIHYDGICHGVQGIVLDHFSCLLAMVRGGFGRSQKG